MTAEEIAPATPLPSPSPHSPVGGQYSVTIDDDDDLPPVPHAPHANSPDENDADSWQYYEDTHSSRLSTGESLRRPLLSTSSLEPAKLNCLNYLNVLTYLANLFVSYGIGVWGLGGLVPTRWEISKEYETLITPAEWAYWLWAPILVFEAIFAGAQLLPHYRARPIIQDGTGLYFFYTCLIQTAWTLFFAFRLFTLSFVAVALALLSLASLLVSQHYSQVRGRKSRSEYWLFKFPFYLHCGWLIICSVVQFSLLFRHLTSNVGVQLAADIVALGAMLPAATFFLTGQPSGPDFVIPLVIIWSYIGIALPLNDPSPELEEVYQHFVVVAVRDAAIFFAGTVGCMLIPRVIIWIFQEFCTISVVELDDISDQQHLAGSLLEYP